MAHVGHVYRSFPKLFHRIPCHNLSKHTLGWKCVTHVTSNPNTSLRAGYSNKLTTNHDFKARVANGPPLEHFIANSDSPSVERLPTSEGVICNDEDSIPYLNGMERYGESRNVYFETYGCQMNVNDTEIAWSILDKSGFNKTDDITESDVVMIMTCSIREGAEQKIWKRLDYMRYLKKKRQYQEKSKPPLKIGILGCMAERLKKKIIEKEKVVDIVCGPDAYRDLPRMLALTDGGQTSVNVLLSLDETYADITPVRLNTNSPSAFVSIMRGCDNMCSYCIVPFTRGRERSRPIQSILDEVRGLADTGIKEITLLGQNVNSYRDMSEIVSSGEEKVSTNLSDGFRTIYKPKTGGQRFADLLYQVSQVAPGVRIRFTSPHPKDFPDEVLHVIRDQGNVCRQLHLPAQSGSTQILEAMRRGYSRESYLSLVEHIRTIIPDVAFSSDFIAGFCGETEDDHNQTKSLIHAVRYHSAYCFPYSMRGKTRAFHHLQDDVPTEVKARRHMELVDVYRTASLEINRAQIGRSLLVLTESLSKRSNDDMAGRAETNIKVIFRKMPIPGSITDDSLRPVSVGDYVVVKITDASSQVLKGEPLYHAHIDHVSSEECSRDMLHAYGN